MSSVVLARGVALAGGRGDGLGKKGGGDASRARARARASKEFAMRYARRDASDARASVWTGRQRVRV